MSYGSHIDNVKKKGHYMEKTMLASNAKVLHYEGFSPREEDKVIKFFKDLAPSVSGIIDLPLLRLAESQKVLWH